MRPDDTGSIAVADGGALFRDLVCQLREELGEGKDGEQEATSLVRGLVRRITVKPSTRGKRQPIEVEAGSAPLGQSTNRDCIVGCGGVQPINYVVHVLPSGPSAPYFVMRHLDFAVAA